MAEQFSERDHKAIQQEEWRNEVMPCSKCNISEICKYKDVVKCIDYPKHVFDIAITCKLKSNYFNHNTKEEFK